MPRAFVGLQVPAELVPVVESGVDGIVTTPHFVRVPADDLHITLRFCGDVDDINAVGDALRRATARLPPTRLSIGGSVRLLGGHALVLAVNGADELASAISDAVEPFTGPNPYGKFIGHLTVGHLAASEPAAGLSRVNEINLSGAWVARDVCLFSSGASTQGPRYRVLVRARLAGSPPVVGGP